MSDYITSREQTTAEYYLRWAVQNCSKRGFVKLPCYRILEIADYIESTRSKKGEWVHDEVTMNGNTVYTPNAKCSICDCYVFQESNFCPNCGADMRGGKS